MASYKSLPSIVLSFAAAAHLALCPQQALGQTSVQEAGSYQGQRYRSMNERMYDCYHADYRRLVGENNFVGLYSWSTDCMDTFNSDQIHNIPALERAAFSEILLARYVHSHALPHVNSIGAVDAVKINDPQFYLGKAAYNLNWLQRYRINISGDIAQYYDAINFVRTPMLATPDPSYAIACLFGGQPTYQPQAPDQSRQRMIDKVENCKEAYNQQPVGLVAMEYAGSMFYLAEYIHDHEPSNAFGLRAAYIARDFFNRARWEGFVNKPAENDTESLIYRYEHPGEQPGADNKIDWSTVALIAIGVFAVGAILTGGGATILGAVGEGAADAAAEDLSANAVAAAAARAEQVSSAVMNIELAQDLARREAATLAVEAVRERALNAAAAAALTP